MWITELRNRLAYLLSSEGAVLAQIGSTPYYVQVLNVPEVHDSPLAECVSNEFLDPDATLAARQHRAIEALGWRLPFSECKSCDDAHPNYFQVLDVDDVHRVLAVVVATLGIYGAAEGTEVRLLP